MNKNSIRKEDTGGSFFAPPPLVATPTLQTAATVAKRFSISRTRLKEVCREAGLEPMRAEGSADWLFDEARISRLTQELIRRTRGESR